MTQIKIFQPETYPKKFPNHPFKVLDDAKMDTLVDSIRENGILNPILK